MGGSGALPLAKSYILKVVEAARALVAEVGEPMDGDNGARPHANQFFFFLGCRDLRWELRAEGPVHSI